MCGVLKSAAYSGIGEHLQQPHNAGSRREAQFFYTLLKEAGTGVASGSDLTRKVTIVNELGLHARPAAKIAQIARNAAAAVWVVRGPEQVDASSIMELLTLACEKGTTLTFTAVDPADRHILEALVQLVENGFEE